MSNHKNYILYFYILFHYSGAMNFNFFSSAPQVLSLSNDNLRNNSVDPIF